MRTSSRASVLLVTLGFFSACKLGKQVPDAGTGGSLVDACDDEHCATPSPCADGCAADEVCLSPDGARCGGEGVCTKRPTMCPDMRAPVCGCDGKTYDSGCLANQAGVDVATPGTCDAMACDIMDDSPCPEGQFCVLPPEAACGTASTQGACIAPPPRCEPGPPACGCDGRTYDGPCAAAMHAVSIGHPGPCEDMGAPCEVTDDSPCPDRHFCALPPEAHCGMASTHGMCLGIPEMCGEGPSVCGCDGVTYDSGPCMAAMAGVSVAYPGPCGEAPHPCDNYGEDTCGPHELCDYPDDGYCGDRDVKGMCVPIPETCPDEVVPVCGCDGHTYDNPCWAHHAGTDVIFAGPCPVPPEGDFCGGFAGIPCPEHHYCDYDEGCGFADGGGHCKEIPEICTAEYDPVCGCNGKTYSNACEAAGAGQSVKHHGECT